MKLLNCVWLFATPWTVAHQAPPSREFSRQEYWSRLLFPSPGYLPDPGIEPRSPTLQADALPSWPQGKPQFTLITLFSLHLTGISKEYFSYARILLQPPLKIKDIWTAAQSRLESKAESTFKNILKSWKDDFSLWSMKCSDGENSCSSLILLRERKKIWLLVWTAHVMPFVLNF